MESPPNVGQQAGGASNAGHPAAHADQAATRDGDQITDAAKGVDLSAMEGKRGWAGPVRRSSRRRSTRLRSR